MCWRSMLEYYKSRGSTGRPCSSTQEGQPMDHSGRAGEEQEECGADNEASALGSTVSFSSAQFSLAISPTHLFPSSNSGVEMQIRS